jgi:hypothetical protein
MELKTSTTIMRFFNICICISFSTTLLACGWNETAENTRLALFRAQQCDLSKINAYNYSADNFYTSTSVNNEDRLINCREWQKKIGAHIQLKDIYTILYNTTPEQFETAYQLHTLAISFANNTFIRELLLKKNNPFLRYISTAKTLEYNSGIEGKWESWNKTNYNLYTTEYIYAEKANLTTEIAKCNDVFLKQRYAFLKLRASFYEQNTKNVEELYTNYFSAKNNTTILQPWAMYYMALCTTNKALSNYYLSKVMVTSNEKACSAMQHFDQKIIKQTLTYAQNNFEKGIILTMACMRNPAPALTNLQTIHNYIPHSQYFSFLITREINKLEDWIFTPKYTQNGPAVKFNYEEWYNDYDKARKKNYIKDSTYLCNLTSFLITLQPNTNKQDRDFINSAIAQLCFINDNVKLGKYYVNKTSSKANASIQLQKNIQLSLVTLKQNNIKTNATKQALFTYFNAIENAVNEERGTLKCLYSLYRIASKTYAHNNDNATAGLLFLKSENKKESNEIANNKYEGYYYPTSKNYYTCIGYFERFATIVDMDNLIELIQRKNKTPFEKYICTNTTLSNINSYKDVKGTIAFRANNLAVAQATFAQIPDDFWQTNYEFKQYLNENPFFPKVIQSSKKRDYNYKFNKKNFVDTLLILKKQNTVKSAMLLANAYLNVSIWGNSWMMNAYDWTCNNEYNYSDYFFGGNRTNREQTYQNGNYYNCNLAKYYYKKALILAKNNEEKAMASLMIFECDYLNYSAQVIIHDLQNAKFKPGNEIYNFNTLYASTNVYKQYNCPLLQSFIN